MVKLRSSMSSYNQCTISHDLLYYIVILQIGNVSEWLAAIIFSISSNLPAKNYFCCKWSLNIHQILYMCFVAFSFLCLMCNVSIYIFIFRISVISFNLNWSVATDWMHLIISRFAGHIYSSSNINTTTHNKPENNSTKHNTTTTNYGQ